MIHKLKNIAIFIVLLFPMMVMGQSNSVEDRVSNLENLYIEEANKNEALTSKIGNLENKIESLKDKLKISNDSLASQSILLQKKTNNLLELQAQSEEAVNLSLGSFEKNYLDQNKSIAYLKSKMQEDLLTKLTFYGIIILLFGAMMFWGVKIALKKLLIKQSQGWKEFNESLFRK